MSDIASWLGSVAERSGNYPEAITRFSESSSRVEELVRLEPAVARWRFRLADSSAFVGDAQVLLGRRDEGLVAYTRAKDILDPLVAQDPTNRQWQQALLNVRLKQLGLSLVDRNGVLDTQDVTDIRAQLESLVATEPASRQFAGLLTAAWRLESQARRAAQRADANEAALRAIELAETLVRERRADDKALHELAQSCILAGRIAASQEQPEIARQYWNRVLDVLAPYFPSSNNWRFLDPAAQALALLGRNEEARPLIARLHGFGYHPLDPLAASTLDNASPVSPIRNQ
jgi:serine/threonine-protein kinase